MIAPASASARIETNPLPEASDTTNTASVENKAEPAASPSMPSIRLKAFVIHNTHTTVSGSDTQAISGAPDNGTEKMPKPPR